MELQKLAYDFNVCKVPNTDHIDFTQDFVFLSITPDEISLVCQAAHTPPNATACEPGWKALKVSGILDFGMIGVIANISTLLAAAEMSIFVVSTYNTDYILLKAEQIDSAVQVLARHGYVIK